MTIDLPFQGVLPLILVSIVALVVLFIESVVKESERISYPVTLIGLLAAAGSAILGMGQSGTAFGRMITIGGYGSFLSALFLVSAVLTIILSRDYALRVPLRFGEFVLLIIFAVMGMMLIAVSADLIVLFLGIELMSISLYVLAGFLRKNLSSNEASLKYFILGAFATGFLLYGIALIYGASGTTTIGTILENYHSLSSSTIFWCGAGLLLVGLAFKVGAVPFHMWIPDVYEGSPTPVSAFMASGAKSAAFSAFVLLFAHQFEGGDRLRLAIAVLAAASMIVGNVIAVAQSSIKRMLAYSSIAHAGYMLVGLAAGNQLGRNGILFYLTSYTFMTIGAFGVLSLLEQSVGKNLTYDNYAGLARNKPSLAAMMSIFMFSLAGIPPLGGFVGKYYMFVAAISSGLTWLAIIGVLTSLISVYYYLRLVMVMYFQDGSMEYTASPAKASLAVLVISACVIIQLGVYPSSLLTVINSLF